MVILALIYYYMFLFKQAWLSSDYRYILYFAALAPLAELVSLQSKVLLAVKKYTSYLVCYSIIRPVLFIVALLCSWKFYSLNLATVFYCLLISYVLSFFCVTLNIKTIKNRIGCGV